MITENLSTLKIHKLTQTQYDRELAAGRIDESAIYLTPDEEIDLSQYATVEQLNTKANTTDVVNLPGRKTAGMLYADINGAIYTCSNGAEVFNDNVGSHLNENGIPTNGSIAAGEYSHAEGYHTIATGAAAHAEGNGTKASYLYAHAEGHNTVASSYASHAEGYSTTASGFGSHVEGLSNTASADGAHAEGTGTTAGGISSHAEGYGTNAQGDGAHAEGYHTVASGEASHADGYYTTALRYQHASGKYNAIYTGATSPETQDASNSDAVFIIGYGTQTGYSNAFRVSSGGKCFGATAFTGSGADFAELFEWADGNPDNEDRRGLFVTLDGEQIRLANSGDDVIGAISGAQAFIGNSASEEWHDKYLTDVFGTRISQEVEVPEKVDEETGRVIAPAHSAIQYVVNPDYDPEKPYVMRENRKEWGIVGLLGQIVVIDDGTCVVGGYVAPSENGVGTASNSGYRVMKRIDETHIKVLVK